MSEIILEVGKTYYRRNRKLRTEAPTDKIVEKNAWGYVGESGLYYDKNGQHMVTKSGLDLVKGLDS